MKTQIVGVLIVVFFSLMLGSELKAQIPNPYKIVNTTACTFSLNWQAATPNCLNVCSSGSAMTIGPGANLFTWGGACLPNPCDFKVQITRIGTVPLTPVYPNCSVLSGSTTFPNPAGSGCPGSSFTIVMTPAGATVN